MGKQDIKTAVSNGKSEVSRGRSTDKSGSNKSPDTTIFYQLPLVVLGICGLSSGAKELFAKLNFDAWGRSWCRVGVKSLAKCLGTDRRSIRRWMREMERRDMIRIRREGECCCYYLNRRYRVGEWIPLLSETMRRRDVGQSYKLLLCLVSFRQAGNDWCWSMQKAFAAEMGLSVRTIQRLLAQMKAKGEVQIRLRRLNRNGGNKYALTCGAVLGGRIFGSISHTTICTPLNKTMKAKSYLKAIRQEFLSGGLSPRGPPDGFGPEAVYFELVGCGIHEKVARPLAFDDKQPFESVVQAVNNAKILRAVVWKRAREVGLPDPKFNVAGYVVNALNAARREGEIIGTTRLFRAAAEEFRELKIAKARRGKHKPRSEAEVKAWVAEQKRALGVATG